MNNKINTISNLLLVISFSFLGLTIVQSDIFEDELIVNSSHCWICDAHGCTNASGGMTGVTECEDAPGNNPPCIFDGETCGGPGGGGTDPIFKED